MQDGRDKELDKLSKVNRILFEDAPEFQNPSDVERSRAQRAFSAVNEVIQQRDLNSDNIFEDLLSEKSFNLDRVSKNLTFYFFSSPKLRTKSHKMSFLILLEMRLMNLQMKMLKSRNRFRQLWRSLPSPRQKVHMFITSMRMNLDMRRT